MTCVSLSLDLMLPSLLAGNYASREDSLNGRTAMSMSPDGYMYFAADENFATVGRLLMPPSAKPKPKTVEVQAKAVVEVKNELPPPPPELPEPFSVNQS